MRYCTDCRWYDGERAYCECPRCYRSSPVFGPLAYRALPLDAVSVREDEEACGGEARWHQGQSLFWKIFRALCRRSA